MRVRLRVVVVASVVMVSCAEHRMPKPVGAVTAPRVGWVIMQGSSDNPDEEFVCQSNPRSSCEMSASRTGRQVFSEVHLYFHPIGVNARYEGRAHIGFLGQGHSMQLNESVKPEGVSNHSVVGIVTDKPGEYAMDLSVDATTPTGPAHLQERIPIAVK